MCNTRVNLRKYYVNQYGLETSNKIRQLEYLKTKHARLLSSLNFLKRCRDHDLIPVCVQISPKKDIKNCNEILRQASKRLLCQLIRQHRSDARQLENTINISSNELNSRLSKTDWQKCLNVTNNRALVKYEEFKQRQVVKFEKLAKKLKYKSDNTNHNLRHATLTSVVNLSKQTLDEPTIEILRKGLNFAPAPTKIPFEDIICNVEECLYNNKITKEESEAIRQDISCVLRRSKLPKNNVSRDEALALKELRNNEDLTVLRADKGNATVIMDTSDYNIKIQEILADTNTYKKVNKDPTNKVSKQTADIINKYSSKLNLDMKSLVPSCAKPPKLYGLPKIHKKDTPLRPIVSQIDTPTYKLAKHIAKILSPLRGLTSAHVKDSNQFVNDIKHLKLTNSDIMVSFDVQSLFTSLPVFDCIEVVKRKLEDNKMPIEYAELLKHCLTSGYLMWKDEFYVQVDGIAMGSPVSPIVADIYMEDFEARALRSAPAVPKIYKRYVDDTFTIIPNNQTTAFLQHLNSINSKIQFTMELQAQNSLAFLDILVLKNPDNTLGHTVYRKPTHTDRYLNGKSHHHPSQLATVGKSLFQRAKHLCDAEHLEDELQHVRHALINNKLPVPRQRRRNHMKPPTVERQPALLPYVKGVTDRIGNILKKVSIRTIYKPHKKVSQFLRPVKSNIPLQCAGVYKLDCDCGLSYIGQTKRSIGTRIKEHVSDVKNRRTLKSAVCEHTIDKPNHYLRFDKPKILLVKTDIFLE